MLRWVMLSIICCLQLATCWRPNILLQARKSKKFRGGITRFYRTLDDEEMRPENYLRHNPLLQSLPRRKPHGGKQTVTNVEELRGKILDEGKQLQELNIVLEETPANLLNHETLKVIVDRYKKQSKPGERFDDHIVALSLEGGGMRGAVTAGMAAAIDFLGLTDSFDRIYGSSAGSVIGAYIVSRQMCMDVYVDILPAAKRSFVCLIRLLMSIAHTSCNWMLSKFDLPEIGGSLDPGMNISFVLDGIMDEKRGIRPLDMERFKNNDQFQQLRVVSSCVKDGKLFSKCFGSHEFDSRSGASTDQGRHGLFACLEASMTVPGATGPPVQITTNQNETCKFFDAFCFEPLPYRSAVEEGSSHVLVLCSRPSGYVPKTTLGVYEKAIAPVYFESHREPGVAEFFKSGGQQYIYAEDLLTLEEGKHAGLSGIAVPPTELLYGVEKNNKNQQTATNRHLWKKAHLLPLKVPHGTPELPTLQQKRVEVGDAVRSGFAAAYDLLAPALNITSGALKGSEVAGKLFPRDSTGAEDVLQSQPRVLGDAIQRDETRRKRDSVLKFVGMGKSSGEFYDDGHQRMLYGHAAGQTEHLPTNLRQST